MKRIIFVLIIVFFAAAFLFLFWKNEPSNKIDGKPRVTTSVYPMYFLTSRITGGKIDVINITPAGAEPHDYQLTPSDIIKIRTSKLLVLNGSIEPWSGKIIDDLKNKNVQIIAVGEDYIKNGDPHVWLSPRLAKFEAQKIASAIEQIDPANRVFYEENLQKLESELDNLDQSYRRDLRVCATRRFVTSHQAFTYLANEYGLQQISIEGLSPDEEPSLSKIAELANLIRKDKIKYVFFESLVSPKLAQTLANEAQAETLVLDPIEGIKDEDLRRGIDYLTLMNNKLQNLR